MKDEEINFYKQNIDIIQILSTIIKRAEGFYSKFTIDEIKPTLIKYFCDMDKAALLNDLNLFFFNEQKQIETLINYGIEKIITSEKLFSDMKSESIIIPRNDKSPITLKNYILNKEYNKDQIEAFDENKLTLERLSIAQKINVFYLYFISNSEIGRDDNLSFYTTNTINAFRIRHSHGNAKLTEYQSNLIAKAENINQEDRYFFFDRYYQALYKIASSLNKRSNGDLLF